MDRVLVVDASPLILFARIDRLDLLASLAKRLVLPEAVMREIQAGSERDGTADKIERLPSILRIDDRPVPDQIRLWDLGAGESQVLAHCLERSGSEVVLDDLAARRCARSLGLPMIGTFGRCHSLPASRPHQRSTPRHRDAL